MIDNIENGLELVLTGTCTAAAMYRAYAGGRRIWVLFGLFTGVYFLGDLYWLLYLVFYHTIPNYSFIPYLSWYASYLFLYLILLQTVGRAKVYSRLLWLIPAFTAGMAVYYMQWGSYFSNIVSAVLLALIIRQSVKGLMLPGERQSAGKKLCSLVLLFCAMEYASWTASCFENGSFLYNLYYVFQMVLTLCFPVFIPVLRKAEAEASD